MCRQIFETGSENFTNTVTITVLTLMVTVSCNSVSVTLGNSTVATK